MEMFELVIWSIVVGAMVTVAVFLMKKVFLGVTRNQYSAESVDSSCTKEATINIPETDKHKISGIRNVNDGTEDVKKVSSTDRVRHCRQWSNAESETKIVTDYESIHRGSTEEGHNTHAVSDQNFDGSEVGPAYYAIIACNDKLISTLSADPLSVATTLVARGFIPPNTEAEMRITSFTPNQKASILMEAIRNKVKTNPRRLHELMRVLQQHPWTGEIAEILHSSFLSKSHGQRP